MGKHREGNLLFATVRIFVISTTLLLLTITVMQSEDPDGYQATHLVFMPRNIWEMDDGRGMLHDPDYYNSIDNEAYDSWSGWYQGMLRQAAKANREDLKSSSVHSVLSLNLSVVSSRHHPTLRHNMPLSGLAGNQIPLGYTPIPKETNTTQWFVYEAYSSLPMVWWADTLTPPPRLYSGTL